jgi:hypothetical protein
MKPKIRPHHTHTFFFKAPKSLCSNIKASYEQQLFAFDTQYSHRKINRKALYGIHVNRAVATYLRYISSSNKGMVTLNLQRPKLNPAENI